MMKSLVSAYLLMAMFSQQTWAGISEGHFSGKGLWRDQANQGDYQVETLVQGTTIDTTYRLNDGSQKKHSLHFEMLANDFFEVKSSKETIGTGYCLKQAELCHYEIQVGEFRLEETLTMLNGSLYRFGSKNTGGHRIMWQEAQKKD